MPRRSLPPPPPNPERPPSVEIAGERIASFRSPDDLVLEGRLHAVRGAQRAVVLCHPHPLYGGTMNNAMLVTIAKALRDAHADEVAYLRFNYRGVESSQGSYDGGSGETQDVMAAIDALLREVPEARVSVCGYSFGAWVGLRAAFRHPAVERLTLLAPAVSTMDFDGDMSEARPLLTEIFVGDRDELVDVRDARDLASRLGSTLHVVEGSDHFFLKQRRVVASMLLPFLTGMPHLAA